MQASICTSLEFSTLFHGRGNEQSMPWKKASLAAFERRKSALLVKAQAGAAGKIVQPSAKGCASCKGKGAVECPGCKGSGKNKRNGNIFERWKCYDCQGFGLISCKKCGAGGRGLTPEQRGDR